MLTNMSSSFEQNENDRSRHQSKIPTTSNNLTCQKNNNLQIILPNGVPSTSTTPYEKLSNSENVSCAHIRKLNFIKNSDKNIPAPSEQFLVGVNCAVIKLLQEIEKNHKFCANKNSNRLPKSRKRR
ncbi:uncharacterized protein LOC112681699 [Sipha flava]|uniref:Uncharacterized protein LOC112681699 n=1 Tax=Sipha flava TaxID=143950 RepID=A0A2S2QJ60_9HEMI|nr:uncharacterized protein LOC112681699 [Sipha flava]